MFVRMISTLLLRMMTYRMSTYANILASDRQSSSPRFRRRAQSLCAARRPGPSSSGNIRASFMRTCHSRRVLVAGTDLFEPLDQLPENHRHELVWTALLRPARQRGPGAFVSSGPRGDRLRRRERHSFPRPGWSSRRILCDSRCFNRVSIWPFISRLFRGGLSHLEFICRNGYVIGTVPSPSKGFEKSTALDSRS